MASSVTEQPQRMDTQYGAPVKMKDLGKDKQQKNTYKQPRWIVKQLAK